jgi:sugar phosphate isomerase/epimerase
VLDINKHKFFNVSHIILHHGYVPKTSKPESWLKRTTVFWQDYIVGKSDKVKFHIENMLELDPLLLSDVITEINSSNVDICLDIGHAHQ